MRKLPKLRIYSIPFEVTGCHYRSRDKSHMRRVTSSGSTDNGSVHSSYRAKVPRCRCHCRKGMEQMWWIVCSACVRTPWIQLNWDGHNPNRASLEREVEWFPKVLLCCFRELVTKEHRQGQEVNLVSTFCLATKLFQIQMPFSG